MKATCPRKSVHQVNPAEKERETKCRTMPIPIGAFTISGSESAAPSQNDLA